MKLRHTSDEELTKISALLFGITGIGKTTSLDTLPEEGTLILCGERGTLPLRLKNYQVLTFVDWTEIHWLIRACGNPEIVNDAEIKAAMQGAKIIVLDSLNECSDVCIRQIVQVDRRIVMLERSEGKRDTPVKIYEEQMAKDDWGLYKTRMMNLMSALGHLPIHVIVNCLEGWREDKDGGVMLRTVALSGQAARDAPSCFDLVLHMENATDQEGNPCRVWRTATDGEIIAKDGSRMLNEFEPTNWTDLFKKILKGDK